VGSFPVVVIQLMTPLSAWLVAPLLLSCACVEPVVAGVVVVVAAVEEPHTVAAAAAAVLDSTVATYYGTSIEQRDGTSKQFSKKDADKVLLLGGIKQEKAVFKERC
jgi:hypothetical protein